MSNRRALVFTLWFLCFAGSVCAQKAPTQTCKITGTVTDLSDAIVGGGQLFFISKATTHKTQITEGTFEVELPQGTYDILSEFQKHANLIISCRNDPPVHIYSLPACVSEGCPKLGADFDVYESGEAETEALNLVIAHYKKKKSRDQIIYSKAILTYQHYTVIADELVVDRKSRQLTWRGDCSIDDGFGKKKCTETSLNLAPQIMNSNGKVRTVTDVQNERTQHKFFWPTSDK